MKSASRFAVAALASAVSLAAVAQGPKQREAERLALFQRHASPPQRSIHYFRTEGFEYLGKDAQGQDVLALWTDVNHVYLLALESPCINLQYANGIALTSTSGNVSSRSDFVKYDRDRRCRIETIQKVDYRALKSDKQG
ncbi:MAG TPA: DUF6491 family protein [Rhodanobacteraceae bacterium]|nr:DUF6491 family protein [Rhodanobacteraceae bacterium]